MDRRQNNGSVKAVSPCHCPGNSCTVQLLFELPCLGRVTRTMSVALLLRNNSKRKKSNFRSPAPPPYSWSPLGQLEGPAPPPSSRSLDLLIMPRTYTLTYTESEWNTSIHWSRHQLKNVLPSTLPGAACVFWPPPGGLWIALPHSSQVLPSKTLLRCFGPSSRGSQLSCCVWTNKPVAVKPTR